MQKVVLITGVSSGLGKATAEFLLSKGYKVYGTSRKGKDQDVNFPVLQLDLMDEKSVASMVEQVIAAEGRIDVLVNNAGIGLAGAVENFSTVDLHQEMETNFYGCVRMCRAVLPVMRKQSSGTIINFSSIGGLAGLPFQAFYSSSKFAIEGFSQALYTEVKPFNIHVVIVNPGDFKTSFTANRNIVSAAKQENPYQAQFLKTIAVIEKEEHNGDNPLKVAKLVDRIIRSRSPRVRYLVGKFHQRLFVRIKPFLPESWLLKILAIFNGIQ
jgi:NAD(P)-dependent dehydrogenase (short-subunit alcohol dehydrogenase family)